MPAAAAPELSRVWGRHIEPVVTVGLEGRTLALVSSPRILPSRTMTVGQTTFSSQVQRAEQEGAGTAGRCLGGHMRGKERLVLA